MMPRHDNHDVVVNTVVAYSALCAFKISHVDVTLEFAQKLLAFCLRLHDPAYFCENLDLYIFVLFSFILSDGDLSS